MLVIACQIFAVVVDVPRLPVSPYGDGEMSSDTAFSSDLANRTRTFKIEMSFNATMTNNVQISFGHDQAVPGDISINTPNGLDGKLAAEETDMIIGWDSGKWFLRSKGLRTRYSSTVTNFVAGSRTFVASINLYQNGTPKEIIFTDNGQKFTFKDFKVTESADWLKPDDWSLLRVTTRGWDVSNEDVKVKFDVDKMLIIIQ